MSVRYGVLFFPHLDHADHAGPGIRRGHSLTVPLDIYDTAATPACLVGVEPPAEWIARPVTAAFLPIIAQ